MPPAMSKVFLVCMLLDIVFGQVVLDREYWEKSARGDLEASLKVTLNTQLAKNVIIFVGDGMGPNTVTAARIYRESEMSYLTWEKFPHVGVSKTYNNDKQVPDSASTATAMFTGVKTNQEMLGLDAKVKNSDCEGSLREEFRLKSIAQLAQEKGKSTGIVTTTRVTHATPGAMYARCPNRNWECGVPQNASRCKDIGRQLIDDIPGKNFNVIMGGGRQLLKSNVPGYPWDPIVHFKSCLRTDGSDLIQEWANQKAANGVSYAVVNNTKSLREVNTKETDYLLGIFANDHMSYEYKRNVSEAGMPSITEMTTTAIKILMKNQNGFLLMVEGGLIDKGHHDGKARVALEEVIGFNEAVNATVRLLEKAGIKDETLLIVTSDHSHTLSISGYPSRGNSILGIADKSKEDGVPYTTLGYATAGKNNFHYMIRDGMVTREDPTKVDTKSYEYGAQGAILQDENKHGGNDVLIYATGPYAHLFHQVHEQNYITAVIKYAAKLGEYNNRKDGALSSSSCLVHSMTLMGVSFIFVVLITHMKYTRSLFSIDL